MMDVRLREMAQHELSIRRGLRVQRSCPYDDFYINNRRLSDLLKIVDPITPFGWLGTDQVPKAEVEDRFARMLLGIEPSDLRPDRIPIFICGECADYGCGATTCRVTLSDNLVEWSHFGCDNNYEEGTHHPDGLLGHHFCFDRESYEKLLNNYTIKSEQYGAANPGFCLS